MTTDPDRVRAFYEGCVVDFRESWRIGRTDRPLRSISGPDDCEAVPAAVFEAVGFYHVNVLLQDNGRVAVFQADAGGVFTYGVLATTDGSDCHLEVYEADGTLIAAGIPDRTTLTIDWRDRDAVRRHSAMWG